MNTKYWSDTYVRSLDSDGKLVFIHLLTNPLTNISGVYEISLEQISLDTGLSREATEKVLERLGKDGKILWDSGWMVIINHLKHQKDNPSVREGIKRQLMEVPEWLLYKMPQTFLEKIGLNLPQPSEGKGTACIQPVYSLGTACIQPVLLNLNLNSNSNLNLNSHSNAGVGETSSKSTGKKSEVLDTTKGLFPVKEDFQDFESFKAAVLSPLPERTAMSDLNIEDRASRYFVVYADCFSDTFNHDWMELFLTKKSRDALWIEERSTWMKIASLPGNEEFVIRTMRELASAGRTIDLPLAYFKECSKKVSS